MAILCTRCMTPHSHRAGHVIWLRERDGAFDPSSIPPHSGNEDPRPSDCAALALAEQLCRAAHRINSARISRPPHRVRRGAAASCSEEYASYYNQVRTHPSLDKNSPNFRRPQKLGPIAAIPQLTEVGLQHS